MKLLLASNGQFLIEESYQLLGVPKEQIKIGYVTTAAKGTHDTSYLEKHKKAFRQNGYNFEEIDIEGKSKDELHKFFEDKNIIHIEGGNTFYLLQVIRKTGFDEVLKNLINAGKIYVGTSAGASIMGPTIDLSKWIPKGAKPQDIIALGYVPFIIKAHYTPEKELEIRRALKTLQHPVRLLQDGQAILVEDDSYKFVGQSEEVKL